MNDTRKKTEIGLMVEQIRKDKKLTQIEVSQALGKSQSWLSKVENGLLDLEVMDWIIFSELTDTHFDSILKVVEEDRLINIIKGHYQNIVNNLYQSLEREPTWDEVETEFRARMDFVAVLPEHERKLIKPTVSLLNKEDELKESDAIPAEDHGTIEDLELVDEENSPLELGSD